ncbi:uncharacterized protein GGS25DRAFT_484065 [Hypoxylon fragiforme]|uniref:uncharacterized protein n=1 Tax=Hypoxylon fragiforme TaxID=63214 RepID=UPI0020C5F9F5|nr:uncharacterized protein GGS25DRAFT_484065 [Hypoxylon fragiforme]KAI2611781.1 hypothetical protein GGS25DRAFT_484065 [Hypoxylon fragiforme]
MITFSRFNANQRKKVALELGEVFNQMLGAQSSVNGVVTFQGKDRSFDSPLYIEPFWMKDLPQCKAKDPQLPVRYSDSPPNRKVVEFLTARFQDQKTLELLRRPNSTLIPEYMDRFCAMAHELDAGGWFENVPSCLAHRDLAPRNILVTSPTEATQRPFEPIIKAVLDWDSAVLAPMFVACAPPQWLWGWKNNKDEDEGMDYKDPPTPEARDLKRLFETSAGPDYFRFAYEPQYRLARRLARFAIDGR